MTLEKLNQEMINYYNEIWRTAQLKNIPQNSDSTTKAAWKYKNFSGIENLIGDFLKKYPFNHKSILSIGCGAGKDVKKVKKLFPSANVYGIDTSRYALKEAKKYSDADFVCASAEHLPLRDDIKFDGFIAGHTLDLSPNVNNAEKIISELTKHAAEKSRFYMTFYWDGPVDDGNCPDLELGVCTPVGNTLAKFGWWGKYEGTAYSLLGKSPYAEGVFWVEERTLKPNRVLLKYRLNNC